MTIEAIATESNDAAITTEVTTGGDGNRMEPLFVDEAISEAELRGEDLGEEEAANEGDTSEAEDFDATEDHDDEETAEETATEETPPAKEDKKPPAGTVPHQALKEEREKRQALAKELANLRAEFNAAKATKPNETEAEAPAEALSDFKVLTKEEFKELLEEDAVKAIEYQQDLLEYKEQVAAIKNRADNEKALLQSSYDRVQKAIPGLYEEGSDLGNQLTEFAIEQGFNRDLLGPLADPRTKIIVAGKEQSLGDGAASLVELVYKFQQAVNAADPAKVRAEVEADLRTTITKELLAKIKGDPTGGYRALGDAGGKGEDPGPAEFSEKSYANMTPAQRRKNLGG
jgi:hypothetical protein